MAKLWTSLILLIAMCACAPITPVDFSVQGFTVEGAWNHQALESLYRDLDRITAQLPDTVLAPLRAYPIRILPGSGKGDVCQFNADNASIDIRNLPVYFERTRTKRPALLLGVLMQTYLEHHAPESLRTDVDSAYRAAMESGRYQSVYWTDGIKLQRAKAVSPAVLSPSQYFTAITEAYWQEFDYYPFDYQELERFDPQAFALLNNHFGARHFPKSNITLPPADMQQWIQLKPAPLDPYYRKYLDIDDIPLLASRYVSDSAMFQTRHIVQTMLKRVPSSVKQVIIDDHVLLILAGANERITDNPISGMMSIWWPDKDWDERGRGYGPTKHLPMMICGEENVVHIPNFRERFPTESLMVHEFAHVVDFALRQVDSTFHPKLKAVFDGAMKKKLWADTYSATNEAEYFAEGAQAWYNCCRMRVPDADGKRFKMHTREQLKAYDPALHDLLSEVFDEEYLRGYHFDYE